MRILCITDCQDRPETEIFIRLARYVDKLTVLANPSGRNYHLLLENAVDVRPLIIKSRNDKESIKYIRDLVDLEFFDIVHSFNTRAVSCMIHACHASSTKLLAYRGVTTGVGLLKPESWTTFLHPRLDGIMCVADAIRIALWNVGFLGFRPIASKAVTIHKGHDPIWYASDPISLENFGIPKDSKVICCVSRNSHKKGVDSLIHALHLLSDISDLHLLLVGHIDQNDSLRKLIIKYNLNDRVHFSGYQNNVSQIIRSCDLLVSPSQSGEGLPRVVIEAMCVHTPVVATDAGGTNEVVLDGCTGILVPCGHSESLALAIKRIFDEPDFSHKLSSNAYDFVCSKLSPASTTTRLLSWYKILLA